jgi:hypothetical protein
MSGGGMIGVGWVKPSGATKYHYAYYGTTLCGSWDLPIRVETHLDDQWHSEWTDCPTCAMELRKRAPEHPALKGARES